MAREKIKKEKEPRVPFREKIKDKNYKKFVIFLLIALILTFVSFKLEGYWRQASQIAGAILYFLAYKSLSKYYKAHGKNYVQNFFKGIGRYIRMAYEKIKAKAIEILGLKPRSAFMKGKDEKDIVIDKGPSIFDKLFNFRNRPKWKDMQTNAQKVRFLYLKFLLKISKKGYKMIASHTHNDVLAAAQTYMKKSQDELMPLFENYQLARYDVDRNTITSETVELLKKF